MRGIILGFALALTAGSIAAAKDFIVVSSTDPSIKTGQALDAGEHLALGTGRALTLMRPSGEVLTVHGGSIGAILPGVGAQADNSNFAAVQALFAPPPSGRTFGARRGLCPGPEILDNIAAIVRSDQHGCKADARSAFIDYLKAHGVDPGDADRLYTDTVAVASDDAAGH